MTTPDPLIVAWQSRQLRVRHDAIQPSARRYPHAMPDHDTEMDAIVADLEESSVAG